MSSKLAKTCKEKELKLQMEFSHMEHRAATLCVLNSSLVSAGKQKPPKLSVNAKTELVAGRKHFINAQSVAPSLVNGKVKSA